MRQTRFHLVLSLQLERAVKQLGARWGLDRTNTIRHCIAIAAEQEFGEEERATKRLHEPKQLPKYRKGSNDF